MQFCLSTTSVTSIRGYTFTFCLTFEYTERRQHEYLSSDSVSQLLWKSERINIAYSLKGEG